MIAKQPLGKHKLRVEAQGYAPFEDEVDVHFQKVSQVVVRLLPASEVIGTGKVIQQSSASRSTRRPGSSARVGVAAVALGARDRLQRRQGRLLRQRRSREQRQC